MNYKVTVIQIKTAEVEIEATSAEEAKKVAEWGVCKGYTTMKPFGVLIQVEEA